MQRIGIDAGDYRIVGAGIGAMAIGVDAGAAEQCVVGSDVGHCPDLLLGERVVMIAGEASLAVVTDQD